MFIVHDRNHILYNTFCSPCLAFCEKCGLSVSIQELLGNTKPMVLQLEPLNLNQVLNERIQFWESQQQIVKKVTLIRDFDPDLSIMNLDKRLIRQLIMNMIINACEAIPDGGTLKVITRRFSNDSQKENGNSSSAYRCTLMFEDTGCGIGKEELPQIFDPFFTTREGGTGLGLSAVYRILGKHDATIQIKSQPGIDTCFIIKLPLITYFDPPR